MKRDRVSDLVRRCFSAWESRDSEALEELLADDFTFTSPNDDDHISKEQYWKKCWPEGERIHAIRVEKLFEHGDEAFVRYKCELKDGARFRNTEYFRIEGKDQGGRGLLRIACKNRRVWHAAVSASKEDNGEDPKVHLLEKRNVT